MTDSRSARRATRATARHRAARLAAVQALYQMEMTGQPVGAVIDEFIGHRLGRSDLEAGRGATVNETLFAELVRGTRFRTGELDDIIQPLLAEGWSIDRLEVVLRCILRLGLFELMTRPEVPAATVIKEYVDLADEFLSGSEPGMVNGILDRLARRFRPGELEEHHDRSASPTG